jgi:CheY-like chemotaxis protein
VKQLVELMDGTVGASSQMAEGTTIWFNVRLQHATTNAGHAAAVENSGPESTAESGVPITNRKYRILVADDNTINQRVALAMLQQLGLLADAVANGAEALEKLSTIAYDLVLMDVQMPVMDGLEATKRIRGARDGTEQHLPIIALTAGAMQGDRASCLEAGMDDFITKPVMLKALAKVLTKWLPECSLTETRSPATESVSDLALTK